MTEILIFALVPVYVLGLFALAWWSDRHPRAESPRLRAAVYGLSIAVYTGSWIYFSTIGAAARTGWGFLTTYGGPVLVVTLFIPVMLRIAKIVKRENIVSIADFLASRYGKSRVVGTLATSVALLASLPFIAQQLRGLSMAWSAIWHTESSSFVVLVFAVVLAGFVILFGARRPTLTEHNRGLVRVIAAETVFKLVMLMMVALLSLMVIASLSHKGEWLDNLAGLRNPPQINIGFFYGLLVAAAGFLCTPRLFYTAFVQLEKIEDIKTGRWFFVGCLIGGCVFLIPIVIAGTMVFHGDGADLYILKLPQQFGGQLLTILIFLGAFSCLAAPAMVETVAISAMVSNELVLPLLARTRWRGNSSVNIGRVIVNIRRVAICVLLLLGWLYSYFTRQSAPLGALGVVASAGIVQFLPVLLGGLFWRRGHAAGAIAGLCGGCAIWLYTVVAPQLFDNFLRDFGGYLSLLGESNSLAFRSLGLIVNTTLYVSVSLLIRPRLIDRIQASAFMDVPAQGQSNAGRGTELRGTVGDLKALVVQFLGPSDAADAFEELEKAGKGRLRDKDKVDPALARATQRILAGVVGASLARRVMGMQLAAGTWELTDVLRVLDDAAQAVQFNRELLQTTLDNLAQGVYVVDREGRMVAWNARFVELFHFPSGFIHVGQHIGETIRFTLADSDMESAAIEAHVEMRLAQIRQGIPYELERGRRDGTVLKVNGAVMPGGRYVTSFTDVTELRRNARELERVNELLEERVTIRTQELTAANTALAAAKSRAEKISNSQARFLAAASHDLLQPLHAARLFMGALREELPQKQSSAQELANNADLSIESANRLLRALLNLSRLEVGGVKLEVRPVSVKALLNDFQREFEPVATDMGLKLRVISSDVWALSDPDLLRSVLQNLIGNAVRYTRTGAVLVCCRREKGGLRFEVRDSGPGIPENALGYIFEEFSRLPSSGEISGAGLGLAIADRICKLLNHKLTVRSALGQGSTFSVSVPTAQTIPSSPSVAVPGALPVGLRILCVENDVAVLQSMEALLTRWGASVSSAASMGEALALKGTWDVLLADYHLEADGTGLDLIEAMMDRTNVSALITADQSEETISRAAVLGIEIIQKPVAPASLRIFLSRVLRVRTAAAE